MAVSRNRLRHRDKVYNSEHPVVSFRPSTELAARLDTLRLSGRTVLDIVTAAAFDGVVTDDTAYGRGYDAGAAAGRRAAADELAGAFMFTCDECASPGALDFTDLEHVRLFQYAMGTISPTHPECRRLRGRALVGVVLARRRDGVVRASRFDAEDGSSAGGIPVRVILER